MDGVRCKKDGNLKRDFLLINNLNKFNEIHDEKIDNQYLKDENKNLLIDHKKTISECIQIQNLKLKNLAINLLIEQDDNDLKKLKDHLDNLQKNMDFIKENLLPYFERIKKF